MANIPPIQFRRSTVGGRIPTDSDLLVGEIALNLADKKIYTKDHNGDIVTLGGGGILAVDSEGVLHKNFDSDEVKQKENLFFDMLEKRLVYWDSELDVFTSLTSTATGGASIESFDSDGAFADYLLNDSEKYKQKSSIFLIKNRKSIVAWDSDVDEFVTYGGGNYDSEITALTPYWQNFTVGANISNPTFTVTYDKVNQFNDSDKIYVLYQGMQLPESAYSLDKVSNQWVVQLYGDSETAIGSTYETGDEVRIGANIQAGGASNGYLDGYHLRIISDDDTWSYSSSQTSYATATAAPVGTMASVIRTGTETGVPTGTQFTAGTVIGAYSLGSGGPFKNFSTVPSGLYTTGTSSGQTIDRKSNALGCTYYTSKEPNITYFKGLDISTIGHGVEAEFYMRVNAKAYNCNFSWVDADGNNILSILNSGEGTMIGVLRESNDTPVWGTTSSGWGDPQVWHWIKTTLHRSSATEITINVWIDGVYYNGSTWTPTGYNYTYSTGLDNIGFAIGRKGVAGITPSRYGSATFYYDDVTIRKFTSFQGTANLTSNSIYNTGTTSTDAWYHDTTRRVEKWVKAGQSGEDGIDSALSLTARPDLFVGTGDGAWVCMESRTA